MLEAPFASIAHMAAVAFPFLPAQALVRTKYDNLEKIPRIHKPLLVVQGTRDEVIPVAQGEMIFNAAREPKRFVSIPGAHHNDVHLVAPDRYAKEIADFLDRTIPETAPAQGTKRP